MKVLMQGLDSIHTTRQIGWLLKGGCSVALISGRDPLPDRKGDYRFIRTPFARGARLYRKLLPRKPAEALIEWLFRIQYRTWWRRVRPDIVHVNFVGDSAYHFAKADVKPLILTVWGTDVNQHFF